MGDVVYAICFIALTLAFVLLIGFLIWNGVQAYFCDDIVCEASSRFFIVEKVDLDFERTVRVFVDRESKVMYCYVEGYRKGGLCVLVDENGLPMLYDESSDETWES